VEPLPRHPSYDAGPVFKPVRCRRWLALGGVLAVAAVVAVVAVVAVSGLVGGGWSTTGSRPTAPSTTGRSGVYPVGSSSATSSTERRQPRR
jgi:hypothetical protein